MKEGGKFVNNLAPEYFSKLVDIIVRAKLGFEPSNIETDKSAADDASADEQMWMDKIMVCCPAVKLYWQCFPSR